MITRPMTGSPRWKPSATTIALATTPSETKPSIAGVVSVGDERGARESLAGAEPHLGGDLVADEADHAGRGEHPQVRQLLRVDEALIVS